MIHKYLPSSSWTIFFLFSFLQYTNVDHTLEECTSNWNVHIPCHYLVLWLRYHGPESLYDKREFIMIFCILFIIISSIFLVSKHYLSPFPFSLKSRRQDSLYFDVIILGLKYSSHLGNCQKFCLYHGPMDFFQMAHYHHVDWNDFGWNYLEHCFLSIHGYHLYYFGLWPFELDFCFSHLLANPEANQESSFDK